MIFLRFSTQLQVSAIHKYYFGCNFVIRPPGLSAGSQIRPSFTDKTPEVSLTLQCHPWGWWPARVGNSDEGRRRGRSGMGVEWPRGAFGPIWEDGPGGEAAGDGRRRHARVAAAGALAPVRLGPGKKGGAAR
jgi:hypothetical protein